MAAEHKWEHRRGRSINFFLPELIVSVFVHFDIGLVKTRFHVGIALFECAIQVLEDQSDKLRSCHFVEEMSSPFSSQRVKLLFPLRDGCLDGKQWCIIQGCKHGGTGCWAGLCGILTLVLTLGLAVLGLAWESTWDNNKLAGSLDREDGSTCETAIG